MSVGEGQKGDMMKSQLRGDIASWLMVLAGLVLLMAFIVGSIVLMSKIPGFYDPMCGDPRCFSEWCGCGKELAP